MIFFFSQKTRNILLAAATTLGVILGAVAFGPVGVVIGAGIGVGIGAGIGAGIDAGIGAGIGAALE
jgi:hypothetical protein